MDISKFDTRALADEGKEFPILHPFTREPLGDDKGPATWIIRPLSSPKVKAGRKLLTKNPKDDPEDQALAMNALHIVGFKNLTMNGRELTAADAATFLSLSIPEGEKDAKGVWKQINKTFTEQLTDCVYQLGAELGNVKSD
jgi:hypothetical protein